MVRYAFQRSTIATRRIVCRFEHAVVQLDCGPLFHQLARVLKFNTSKRIRYCRPCSAFLFLFDNLQNINMFLDLVGGEVELAQAHRRQSCSDIQRRLFPFGTNCVNLSAAAADSQFCDTVKEGASFGEYAGNKIGFLYGLFSSLNDGVMSSVSMSVGQSQSFCSLLIRCRCLYNEGGSSMWSLSSESTDLDSSITIWSGEAIQVRSTAEIDALWLECAAFFTRDAPRNAPWRLPKSVFEEMCRTAANDW